MLRTKLKCSTVFHSRIDGQFEKIIQTLEDMLPACVVDFGVIGDRHLPLIEFAYNNSYYVGIKMVPYETLYR